MTSNIGTKKLLIVDDSKVSRMIIRARVQAVYPDWEILEACNGAEGIAAAHQYLPDFCTMDINMPGMLGTEAAEQILKELPNIRVVIFSANIQETFQERQPWGQPSSPSPLLKNQLRKHYITSWDNCG